jgi:hypothetical protein
MLDVLTGYLENRFRTSESWRILGRVVVTTAMPAALVLGIRTFEVSRIFDGTAPVAQYIAAVMWVLGACVQSYAAFALFRFERKEDKNMIELKARLERAGEGTALAEANAKELSMLRQFFQTYTTQQANAIRRVLQKYNVGGGTFSCKQAICDLTKVDSVFQRTVSEIFHFFNRDGDVRVTLMVPAGDHLAFTNFFSSAHDEAPRAKGNASIEAQFVRNQTVAGIAWAQRRLIIVEDVGKEIEKLRKGEFSVFRILDPGQYNDIGSMFSYPIEDRDETPNDPVVFIINVDSTKPGRFAVDDHARIGHVMKDFGDRLIVQFRLRLLSRLVDDRGE